MEFSIASVPGRAARGLPVRTANRSQARPLIRGRLLSDIFDMFNSGVLVVAADRRVLTWNLAATRLLGDPIDADITCCDLFGCRRPDTPLADTCLTERALGARQGPAAEIVVDVPGRPGKHVAVSTTAFGGGPKRTVLFELRQAQSATARFVRPIDADLLHIQTFGETVVRVGSAELRGGWLDQRPGRLLKLLVARRYTPVHGDVIAESLWPSGRAGTSNTVRHFVHTLREKLEPTRARYQASSFVLARNGGYVLNSDRVRVDADEFESEVKAGLFAFGQNRRAEAGERLRKAMELYCGDFLAEERFEDWAIGERERLRDLATKPLRLLSAMSEDPDAAAAFLERLAEMEPLDVDIHRELMQTWLLQGRRGRAIRHYRVLQSRLMRELGERLSFDLADLTGSPVPP
jgi:DNA-binding SARP family transcriptional activator